MLRIGVIGLANELPKLCSSLSGMEEVQFIGFHALNDSEFKNNFARFVTVEELFLGTDCIYISSKAANHEDLIEKAVKNQIHTLVEFPFVADADRACSLMNLAHEANIKLQVSNPLKFSPVYLGIKDRSISPTFIESQQLQTLSPALAETSVIQNLLLKDIDVILSVVQSTVKKVSATGIAVVNGTPDITNARIEFDNGCIANLTASRISLAPQHSMIFYQKNSYVNVDFNTNEAHIFQMMSQAENCKGDMTLKMKNGSQKEVFHKVPKLNTLNPIQEEVKVFVESVVKNWDNDSTITKALYAIEIAQMVAEKVKMASMIMDH